MQTSLPALLEIIVINEFFRENSKLTTFYNDQSYDRDTVVGITWQFDRPPITLRKHTFSNI